jgi:hypothetical protein
MIWVWKSTNSARYASICAVASVQNDLSLLFHSLQKTSMKETSRAGVCGFLLPTLARLIADDSILDDADSSESDFAPQQKASAAGQKEQTKQPEETQVRLCNRCVSQKMLNQVLAM